MFVQAAARVFAPSAVWVTSAVTACLQRATHGAFTCTEAPERARIRKPGGDPGEQADLQRMQTLLKAAILEVTFGETGFR